MRFTARSSHSTGEPTLALAATGAIASISGDAAALLGHGAADLEGRVLWDAVPELASSALRAAVVDAQRTGDACRAVVETTSGVHEALVHPAADGVVIHVAAAPGEGATAALQMALRQSQERLELALDATGQGMWDWDMVSGEVHLSPHWARALGYAPGELNPSDNVWVELIHPDDLDAVARASDEHLAGGAELLECELRLRRGDGGWVWVRTRGRVVARDAAGNPTRLIGTHTDVTERRRAEETVRRRDAILHAVSFAAQHLLRGEQWEDDVENVLARLGEAATADRVYLFRNDEPFLPDRGISLQAEWVSPGTSSKRGSRSLAAFSYPRVGLGRWAEVLSSGGAVHGPITEFVGAEREMLEKRGALSIVRVPIFVRGAWWGSLGVDDCREPRTWSAGELDALRTAAETLGAAIQRQHTEQALRSSEEQLRHSQKMEAIGRLAGGVAHDFNNLLTAIRGSADLMLMDLPESAEMRGDLEEIQSAVDRAALLTRQLLAFGRRQVLQPVELDFNDAIRQIERMLRRLIGADVEIRTSLQPGLGAVKVDAGQVGQILLNLVVNARDAMPRGGVILIETREAALSDADAAPAGAAGRFIQLRVRDSGTGIDAQTRERIFEPFFTTKEQGKGTGLGLSTVYGIVQQCGGRIEVESELGRGTTFDIFLPMTGSPRVGGALVRPEPVARGGTETVLLVEDEPAVRSLARRVLERNGFTVLEATDGVDALDVLQARRIRIDLLVTDLAMPRMGGHVLAERLRALDPNLKIVLMSGYAAEMLSEGVPSDARTVFLQKPFTPAALLRSLSELIEAGRPEPTPSS